MNKPIDFEAMKAYERKVEGCCDGQPVCHHVLDEFARLFPVMIAGNTQPMLMEQAVDMLGAFSSAVTARMYG